MLRFFENMFRKHLMDTAMPMWTYFHIRNYIWKITREFGLYKLLFKSRYQLSAKSCIKEVPEFLYMDVT